MGRYRGPKVKRFLAAIWPEAKGSSVLAATIAGYKDPVLAGPRLRRRYSDLVEQARIAWSEKAHVSYDEALELLAEVARDKDSKDRVRAINIVLELHGAHSKTDPVQLRKEVASLIKAIGSRKSLTAAPESAPVPAESEVLEAEVLPPQRVAS